ncbi:MAG: polyketide synthase [Kiritimatiellae bacterium]|nr:polyketide synthase [Kiritimatiellia bacterium]
MEDMPIAIVGMSCRFAQANDIRMFWRNIISSRSAFSPLDKAAALPIGGKTIFGSPYPTAGAQLGALYSCRPFEQTFPRQINAGENQDLYFITQLAFDALADAAMRPHSPEQIKGTVRLAYAPMFNPPLVNWLCHSFFVDQTVDVLQRCFPGATDEHMENIRGKLRDSLPSANADAILSASGHRIADWIAREISFSGAASSVDGGGLSGVFALESAIDDLRSGRADVAIAGAVSPPFGRSVLEGLSGKIRFTEEQELFPFDRDAKGTLPGEGGAFFVLKRRSDALAAHDRIYALVRSTATCAGEMPIRECSEVSKAPLSTIAMIEADGSGFPDVDKADIASIQKLWGEHKPGGALVGVGSVKGNVGHCFTAAAAASILKVAQSLYMRVLAPQVAVPHPLERLSNIGSSAYLLDKARPWITGNPSLPRRAVVCANDFDGRRMAVLMEEEPENRR